MSRTIVQVQLTCTHCDHQGAVDGELLTQRLGEALTYSNIAGLSGEFKCGACGSKSIAVSDDQGILLLDPNNVRICQACALPIVFPRLQAVPNTSLCQSCAEEGEQPERPSPYPMPPPELSTCPRCESPSVVRENSQDGNYFIGCTGFPKCRWTEELPEDRV